MGKCGERDDARDADVEWAAAARSQVVDILAGAALTLLLHRDPRPSPDGAPDPEKGSTSAVSGRIPESL